MEKNIKGEREVERTSEKRENDVERERETETENMKSKKNGAERK